MGFLFFVFFAIIILAILTLSNHLISKYKKISINGKHVVITGGSKGLGFEFARLCVSKGAKVTMIARDEKDLKRAKEEIIKSNKNVPSEHIGIKMADVTKSEEIKRVLVESSEERGDIDWLVCNAGSAKPGLLSEASSNDYRSQMELNYLGVVNSVLGGLDIIKSNKNNGKKIIVVSSAMGLVGFAGYSAYAPTKWAVRGFCECLRNELLAEQIGVHIFYASNMDTPGYKTENLIKPKVTSLIEGKSKLFSAEQSALHLFGGISSNQMHITSEFEIEILRMRGAGISTTNNVFLDFILAPFLPLISFFVRMDWDKISLAQLGGKSKTN